MISMLREFNFNKSGILKFLSLSFLTVTFVLLTHQEVQADDVSTGIEAGATVIDGIDTFLIDDTNDGSAGSNLTFSGADARSLTISSDGQDADDSADLGSITVADNTYP